MIDTVFDEIYSWRRGFRDTRRWVEGDIHPSRSHATPLGGRLGSVTSSSSSSGSFTRAIATPNRRIRPGNRSPTCCARQSASTTRFNNEPMFTGLAADTPVTQHSPKCSRTKCSRAARTGVKDLADMFDAERTPWSLRDCGKMPIPRHQNRAPTRIGMKVIQVAPVGAEARTACTRSSTKKSVDPSATTSPTPTFNPGA